MNTDQPMSDQDLQMLPSVCKKRKPNSLSRSLFRKEKSFFRDLEALMALLRVICWALLEGNVLLLDGGTLLDFKVEFLEQYRCILTYIHPIKLK